jgi:hypothetical protein
VSLLTGLIISSTLLLSFVLFITLWRQTTKKSTLRHGGRSFFSLNAEPANPYRAVSIRSATVRCVAIGDTEGERYLVEDNNAPHLPHAVCGSEKCACKYVHHGDRRSGDDRRSIFGVSHNLHIQTGHVEGRRNPGRRHSDF